MARFVPLLPVLSLSLSLVVGALPARADDLTDQLKKGPLVRVEVDPKGRFKSSTVLMDVAAPVELVWATLADFKSYPSYMPRCEEVEVKQKGGYTFVEMDIDTPLVSTSYTSRYQLLADKKTVHVLVVDGDIEDSEFHWQLAPSSAGTRITYWGVVRNFSSVAERLDDDQQSITIGINVVSVLQAAKALKREAERRHKAPRKKGSLQVR
jgi:ribosome-associated toxin RatA of RatAB toxin-antitoxin module